MGQVVGLDHIVLDLIEFIGNNDFIGIFLGVDRMLLQAYIQFREGHGRRISTDSGPELHMVVVLHGTDLDSLKVIQGLDPDISGHDTEILVCHGQKARLRLSSCWLMAKLSRPRMLMGTKSI